jgi:neutral ceramidase
MRKLFRPLTLAILAALGCLSVERTAAAEPAWKAGVATTIITPEKPQWMAGYGGRNKPAEVALHPLWIKVVALEDANGHQGVILSSDTLGIPKTIYDNTCAALKEKHGLERSQIMLHASHTHCGPVLRGALLDIYPLDEEQTRRINAYSEKLEKNIVETVGKALASMEPARVYSGQGESRFAVNRRNNVEGDVPRLRREGKLKGPVDHSVPVLVVRSLDHELKALVFGYACHNTTLSFYNWCGDYAGFAQNALEKHHPGAVAMFFAGCGADQNPLPRRTVELAQRYGTMLASAVEEVLLSNPNELPPVLDTALELTPLKLGPAPPRKELEEQAKATNYRGRWAKRLLEKLNAGEPFINEYPYPLQAWNIGGQRWITMGGEVVVDYSLRFKAEYGPNTWVAGYCNDVMAYIPSRRILIEDVPPRASSRWGYEGNTSMAVYGMPANRWADDVEDRVGFAVRRLMEKVGK